MRAHKVALVTAFASLLFVIAPVVNIFGYPVGVKDILYLIDKAQLVCKGRVVAVRELGNAAVEVDGEDCNAQKKLAVFHVDRIFKGVKVGSEYINIEFLESCELPLVTLENGEYSLVFLSAVSSEVYKFADQKSGKLPITSAFVPVSVNNPSTLELIEAELFASIQDSNRDVVLVAVEQLGNLKKVTSTQPLREVLRSEDNELKGYAYASLIKLGDYSVLREAVKFVEQAVTDQNIRRSQAWVSIAIGNIRSGIVVQDLNEFSGSKNTFLRQRAVMALRAIKSPLSLSYLIQKLDDPDPEIRYHATMGLAAIERKTGEWAPASELFHKREVEYTARWKSWWQLSGKQRYEQYLRTGR